MTTIDNINDDTLFNRTKKKKSKKRLNVDTPLENESVYVETENNRTATDDDYTYDFLLDRAFSVLRERNPSGTATQSVKVALPRLQLAHIGTRRTGFMNFGSICALLKRSEKLVQDFFQVELGKTSSIDSSHALIIRGRFQERHIETVLRSFLRDYVFCKQCHSIHTLLRKSDRLMMIHCNHCTAQYSVPSIHTNTQTRNATH